MIEKDGKFARIKNIVNCEDGKVKLEIEDSYEANRRTTINRITHENVLFYFESEKLDI